jgi:hypothetical protein
MPVTADFTVVPFDLETEGGDVVLPVYAQHPDGMHAFRVRWTGDRSPRGLELPGGLVVGWTQHGVIKDLSGHLIGWYERLVDNGREQEMVLVLPGPSRATNPVAALKHS